MNNPELPFQILSELAGQEEPNPATLADITAAADILDETDCREPSEDRLKALNVIKAAQDRITPKVYTDFCLAGLTVSPEELPAIYDEYPALYWYDRTFSKVLAGVKEEVVPEGHTVLWHVYNMGYVIKTSKHCFAIDLHHRRAEELVPYLDFIAVTHNHDDHYTERFVKAMNREKKPVITNFFANANYPMTDNESGYFKGPERTFELGDITISTYESDHNPKLRRFMQPVEFVCGKEPNACVILSSGDTCNAQQLKYHSPKLDFYIVHPYVGLKVDEAANLLNPKMTLVSHLEEFHHRIDQWRWTWRQGYEAARKIWNTGHDAIVPACGDKIVY